jgi:hypothetical protein
VQAIELLRVRLERGRVQVVRLALEFDADPGLRPGEVELAGEGRAVVDVPLGLGGGEPGVEKEVADQSLEPAVGDDLVAEPLVQHGPEEPAAVPAPPRMGDERVVQVGPFGRGRSQRGVDGVLQRLGRDHGAGVQKGANEAGGRNASPQHRAGQVQVRRLVDAGRDRRAPAVARDRDLRSASSEALEVPQHCGAPM